MRRVLILGAGDAGTTVANKLRRRLGIHDWTITIVDRNRAHLCGPVLLALPFGEAGSENLFRHHRKALRRGVSFVLGEAGQVVPHTHHVLLTDGRRIDFDYLVVATGSTLRPERIPGLVGPQWRRTVHECSTAGGVIALRHALHGLGQAGGRLVVHAAGVSMDDLATPLEFLAKADSYLRRRGVRDTVELVCATELNESSRAAMGRIEAVAEQHKVVLESGFTADRLDAGRCAIVACDGRELPFDLLVTMPRRTGADYIGQSGLGNSANLIPVQPGTLRSTSHADIFAVGSAAEPPDTEAMTMNAAAFADVFVRLSAGLPTPEAPLPGWRRPVVRVAHALRQWKGEL